MHDKQLGCALVAVAAMGLTPAYADVSIGARLSNFGFSLIDLDPNDGITPAITFEDQRYTINGSIQEGKILPNDDQTSHAVFTNGGPANGTVSVFRKVERPHSEVTAGVSGAFANHNFSITTTGSALVDKVDHTFASRFFQTHSFSLSMTLTPLTEVVWSGNVALDGEVTLGRRGVRFEEGRISTQFRIRTEDSSQTFDFFERTLLMEPGIVAKNSDATNLSVSFSNTDGSGLATARLEGFLIGTGASLFPIPEPGTYLMMLCGIGMLAGAIKVRRRSHADTAKT